MKDGRGRHIETRSAAAQLVQRWGSEGSHATWHPTRAALTMAELAEASAAAVILIHCPSQFTADVLHQSKVVYKGGCPCAA